MLSVCIPTYRYDVRPLVHELLRQAMELKQPVEILVYDDASPDDGDWGREELRQLSGINYVELKHNLGRAAIRNRMAIDAAYDYLVMMDADGWPSPAYLEVWMNNLIWHSTQWAFNGREYLPILWVGGRKYAEYCTNSAYKLHWKYGTKRESKTREERAEESFLGFHSNNFLVYKNILLDHPFPETGEGYGHEDTLWGQSLIGTEVLLLQFNNPVIHLGLETNQAFLKKQKEAITNLHLLKNDHPHLRTRLIDLAKAYPFLKYVVKRFPEDWLVRRLMSSSKPSLYWLDILKLKWWFAAHK